MPHSTCDVAVLGGGISGLTVAHHLHRAGVHVRLLEASTSVGGVTQTERRDGFLLEKGPFNVIVKDPAFEALLAEFSEQFEVVAASPAARKRFIYRRGRLHALPTNPLSLITTPLLGFPASCRLLAGLIASPRARHREETIEQAATRRFGKRFADTFVSALIAGIFAGDIRKLSLKACFPSVGRVDRNAPSLIAYGLASALRSMATKRKHPRRWRGLVSIDGGLGALTDAIGRSLGDALATDCRAEDIQSTGSGYQIDFRRADKSPGSLRCRRLVLSVPANQAARLLQPLLPDAAAIIETIPSSSLVVLNLGYRAADVQHPLNGFGFLVPHDEPDFPLMGTLWADTIFPHHVPPNHRLIRVFIGGPRNPHAATQPHDQLIATATNALRPLLGITGQPVLTDLARYPAAIPQYNLGHTDKIDRLDAAVAGHPNLFLAANYLRGISLNDCVRQARQTALRIIDDKGPSHDAPGTTASQVPTHAPG